MPSERPDLDTQLERPRRGRFTAHFALVELLRLHHPDMSGGDAAILGVLLIYLAEEDTLLNLLLDGVRLSYRRFLIEDALRLLESHNISGPALRTWVDRARLELA